MPDGIIPTRTVQGRFLLADGSPAQGSISFKPEYEGLNNNAIGNESYVPREVFSYLDTEGRFSTNLIIGDDDDGSIIEWSYLVTMSISGFSQQYSIVLTSASPSVVEISDILPSITDSGIVAAYYRLDIGTVTTAFDGSATAEITGDFPRQFLNLRLPAGPAGDPGTIVYEPVQNLVPNPSVELTAAPWTGAFGTAIDVVRDTSLGFAGTSSLRFTANNTDTQVSYGSATATDLRVVPGIEYTLSGYVRVGVSGRSGTALLEIRNDGGSVVASPTGSPVSLASGAWTRVTCTFTAATLGVLARPYFRVSNAVNGEIYYLDAVQLEVGPNATGYFDGSTAPGVNGTRWAGTPHNSISSRGRSYYATDFFNFDDAVYGALVTYLAMGVY